LETRYLSSVKNWRFSHARNTIDKILQNLKLDKLIKPHDVGEMNSKERITLLE